MIMDDSGISSDPQEMSDALSVSELSTQNDTVGRDVDGNESDADSDATIGFQTEPISKGSSNKQTFICGTCGECFDRYDKLSDHSEIHKKTTTRRIVTKRNSKTGRLQRDLLPSELPKKCEECGLVLSSRKNWKYHVLQIHKKEYKFKCNVCNFGCLRKSHFENHVLIHSDERNFKCRLCSGSFKQKKGLDRHYKIHTR